MNKDQIKGAIKDAAGKVQEQVGKATGSRPQEVKGVKKQTDAKDQKVVGDLEETSKDIRESNKSAAKRP